MMTYKGYCARVEFDEEAGVFHGEVLHLRDVVTFQGTSVDELRTALKDSVDDYLEFCQLEGRDPDRPYSGKLLVRLEPELHRAITGAAAKTGESLNTWVVTALERCMNGSLSDPQAVASVLESATVHVVNRSSLPSDEVLDPEAWGQVSRPTQSLVLYERSLPQARGVEPSSYRARAFADVC